MIRSIWKGLLTFVFQKVKEQIFLSFVIKLKFGPITYSALIFSSNCFETVKYISIFSVLLVCLLSFHVSFIHLSTVEILLTVMGCVSKGISSLSRCSWLLHSLDWLYVSWTLLDRSLWRNLWNYSKRWQRTLTRRFLSCPFTGHLRSPATAVVKSTCPIVAHVAQLSSGFLNSVEVN